MMEKTAVSPANIAFIKYWGKVNPKLNIPFNDSVSMNLSGCLTTTTVSFDKNLKKDSVIINGKNVEGDKKARVIQILDLVRKMSGVKMSAKVNSKNNFPSDAGIASSASGFSALALAASSAAGLKLSIRELSRLARLGSGSAARSVIDGYAIWKKGTNDENSFAILLAEPSFWKLADIVAITQEGGKKNSSTEGHGLATSSPYFQTRLRELKVRIPALIKAFKKRDFETFGALTEEEAVSLHVAAMTSRPPIFYWNEGSLQVMRAVFALRERGIPAYFTMDAGSNVHVICEEKNARKIEEIIKKLPLVFFTIMNKPCEGTHLI